MSGVEATSALGAGSPSAARRRLSDCRQRRGGSFKAQMKNADASGARWALIVGDNEAAANRVAVKRCARLATRSRWRPMNWRRTLVPSGQEVREEHGSLRSLKNRKNRRPQGVVAAYGK